MDVAACVRDTTLRECMCVGISVWICFGESGAGDLVVMGDEERNVDVSGSGVMGGREDVVSN